MSRWAFSLLGSASLVRSGHGTVNVPASCWPVIGLLLTCPGHRASRGIVAGTLWPEQNEEAARHCLATTLWRFKGTLGKSSGPISSMGDSLSLDDGIWADVLAFRKRTQGIESTSHVALATTRQRLRVALRLYRGDYLYGYEAEWLALERERLRCLYLDTLYALARAETAANDWASVVTIARLLCAAEPLREDAHRMLMEGYARSGNRALALKQFRLCADVLQRELQVDPMPETVELERKLAGRNALPVTEHVIDANRMRNALVILRRSIGQVMDMVDDALGEGTKPGGKP